MKDCLEQRGIFGEFMFGYGEGGFVDIIAAPVKPSEPIFAIELSGRCEMAGARPMPRAA